MDNKLNLGSGEFKKTGYVNVDYYSILEPDIRHDLNQFPYPFENGQFSVIEADHVLEHLDNPMMVMREIHRIANKGCRIEIRVPHFSRGFLHADHKRGFDVTFPLYFNSKFKGGYQGVSFECVHTKLSWFSQPYLKKSTLSTMAYYIGYSMGFVFDIFANLSPAACSRLWCFWVGGFEEIEFIFRKP
jgi:SAM-dependent methyltransferase